MHCPAGLASDLIAYNELISECPELWHLNTVYCMSLLPVCIYIVTCMSDYRRGLDR
jgi:hypothetical protein